MKKKLQIVLFLGFLFLAFPGEVVNAAKPNSLPGFNINARRPVSLFFFNTRYGQAGLNNSIVKGNSDWELFNKPGMQFELGYQKRVKPTEGRSLWLTNDQRRIISYGAGIGFSKYSSEAIASQLFSETYRGHDIENVSPVDVVDRTYVYKELVENTEILFFNVPLFLEIGTANIDELGVFLRMGLNLSMPVINSFEGTGTYSVKGYYPTYLVELEGINELGFFTDKNLYGPDEKYNLKTLQLSGNIGAGVTYPVPGLFGWIFSVSGQYVFGLSNIIEPVYYESGSVENAKMIFNNSEPTKKGWFGFQIGIQYVLGIY